MLRVVYDLALRSKQVLMPATGVGLGFEPAAAANVGKSFFPRWVNVSSVEARRAEVELLKGCSTPLKLVDTPVGEAKEEVMHSITGGPDGAPNLVCMPGYGAGAAFYFRNLDAFCAKFRTYAVDWLGTGNSGRPRFKAKNREEAEEFFLKSLETWREKTGLKKFVLMGHSMGGYLAANYALQHPERVDHLILVCPAAVSKQPENSELPDWAKSPWTLRGQIWRSLTFLWNNGVTPQMAIRGLGPAGRRLVDGYVTKRFTQGMELTSAESTAMGNYFYQITATTGSGEFALRHVMAPFAWGRAPLEERLSGLKVPVTFIYGEQDWMDPKGAQTVCNSIAQEQGPPKNSSDRTIRIIPDSGHFVFIDQPDHFHTEVYKTCEPHLGGK